MNLKNQVSSFLSFVCFSIRSDFVDFVLDSLHDDDQSLDYDDEDDNSENPSADEDNHSKDDKDEVEKEDEDDDEDYEQFKNPPIQVIDTTLTPRLQYEEQKRVGMFLTIICPVCFESNIPYGHFKTVHGWSTDEITRFIKRNSANWHCKICPHQSFSFGSQLAQHLQKKHGLTENETTKLVETLYAERKSSQFLLLFSLLFSFFSRFVFLTFFKLFQIIATTNINPLQNHTNVTTTKMKKRKITKMTLN